MSTIIKANAVKPTSGMPSIQGVAFNFDDMADQANRYLEKVRLQAEDILDQAARQAEQIREKAEAEGRQAALEAVERVMDEKVGKHMQTLMPALEKAVEEVQQSKQSWLNHWHASAVRVASAIASRVIRRELSQTPEIALDLVREALQLAAGSAEITLRLNPTDCENLGGQVDRIIKELHQLAPVEVVADQSITAGGCRLETRFGVIDQQVEAQLKRIEEELR